MEKTKKYLIVGLLGVFLMIGLSFAQTEDVPVDMSIASSTQVDITPNSFTWTNSAVGTILPSTLAQIENIGSSNVTQISIDVPGSYGPGFNPVGSGTSSNIGAGSYLVAGGDNITFGYLNSPLATNELMPIYVITPTNTAAKGRFRLANYEYFWAVATGNGTGNPNTCGNGTLYYFNTTTNIHNISQQGGSDLTSLSGVTLTLNAPATASDGWGFTDISFNTQSNIKNQYCFAVRQDCQVARFWKFNKNVGLGPGGIDAYDNASLCTYDKFLVNDATNGGIFKPGQLQSLYLSLAIPYGTANGSLLQSTMTVRATD